MTPRLLPAAAVEAAIVVAVLLPQRAVPDGPGALSIAFHVLAHAALAFALVRPGGLHRPAAVLALVVASAVGTEGLQLLTSDRTADGWDVVADVVGGVLGLALVRWVGLSARSGAGAGRWRRR